METIRRILFISELADIGGGEKILLGIVERLDKKRFLPIVLCAGKGELTKELEKRKVKVIVIPFGVARKMVGFIPVISCVSILRFLKVIMKERIGLIHSNCFSGVVFSCVAAKLMRIPLVWQVHGWTSGAGVQGIFINTCVDKVVTVSEAVKRFLCRWRTLDKKKVKTIFPGIDVNEFRSRANRQKIRDEFKIKDDEPVIGIIARFQAVKGHRYFLQAAKEIKAQIPSAKFLVVGARLFGHPSDQGYPEEIMRWIREFGLENDCVCTGFRNDISDVLSAMDIMVLSSLRESFGLVLLEAMAAGVPVVSTRCQGPEDIIEDGMSGLLVPLQDPHSLAMAVLSLLNDRFKTIDIVAHARQKVEEFFTIERQVQEFQALYDELRKPTR